jgi:hypothetical protein
MAELLRVLELPMTPQTSTGCLAQSHGQPRLIEEQKQEQSEAVRGARLAMAGVVEPGVGD